MTVRYAILLAMILCSATSIAQSAESSFLIGPGAVLTSYAAPRIALAGDADGDGRADFVGINPDEHVIDFARMSTSGKLVGAVHAREGFGGATIAGACGGFTGSGSADALAVFTDGSVLVAYGMSAGEKTFRKLETVAAIPKPLMPRAPVIACTGDFDGDGRLDVLLADCNGYLLLLQNARGSDHIPHFIPRPVVGYRFRGRRIAAGDFHGDGRADMVWITPGGILNRAELNCLLGRDVRLQRATTVTVASPGDGLAVGHFRGEKAADIIVGQRLLPGGDPTHAIPLPNLPDAKHARGDYAWIAADFNGDGKDDLVRAQRNGDPLDGDHVYIHYAHGPRDRTELQFDDSDRDGLPDAWESGEYKPGGLDLKALGCSSGHADVIVEVQRMEDVPEAALHADMEKANRYFAGLPVPNPDGTTGIALHVLYREPIPLSDGDLSWSALQAKYHPANHRGITHWMTIYNGGGGQSSEMGDGGGCGSHGMPAVFIHEFGHQLGLDHTGRWGPGWCPTYPSLMNYAYGYQLNGKAENVAFSDGRLSSVVLTERHLDEYLPLPMDRIAFLAGPPYRYRMKPAPDGKATLIDWNWNGVFGEKNISADINYGYSTTGGERQIVGKAYTAPAMATCGEGESARLLLVFGLLPPGAPAPPAEVKAVNPGLSPSQPGRLCLRFWQGKDRRKDGSKWSDAVAIEANDVIGEASAASFEHAVWIAYPTMTGVKLRCIVLDPDGAPRAGAAEQVPDSQGAQPTLTAFSGRLVLLLWRDRTTLVGIRWIEVRGPRVVVGRETRLEFASNVPIGAAAGRDVAGRPALWIGLTKDQDAKRPSRWQIRCFSIVDGSTLRQADRFWVDGDQGADRGEGRVTMLWEPDRVFGPSGRWYFLQRWGPGDNLNQMRIAMRIADKSVNGGSLTRRYYDEWTNSRSAPAACWFRGDIVLGIRWFGDAPAYKNDDLLVGFFGRGIESLPMGDFDDLSEIRTYGLAGSLPTVTE